MKQGDNLAFLVSSLRGKINFFLERELAEHGCDELAPSHGAILVSLYEHGQLSLKQISQMVARDKSTVTVLVRKLEKLGYLTKHADKKDSRVSQVKLTAKGRRFRQTFVRISDKLITTLWQDTPLEKRQALCDELSRITERL